MPKFKRLTFAAALLLIACLSASVLTVFGATQVPVPDAIVSAVGNATGDTGGAISNAQGNYVINSWLGTDTYNLTASATGFIDTELADVSVTGGSTTSGQNILMPVSGGISGTVTDATTKAPISGAFVFAYPATGSGSYLGYGETDSSGNYQIITDLATGQYNLTIFYVAGYMDQNKTLISVTQGAMTSNQNIAMTESGSITGTVTDSVSHAVQSGDLVDAINSLGAYVTGAVTDSSGVYVLNTNLPTGTYSVEVEYPTGHLPTTVPGIAVTLGSQTVENIAINPSGIISGTVTSGGTGLAGATVTAISNDYLYYSSATTSSSGSYQINTDLATDTYTVIASYPYSTTGELTGVSVTAGSTTSGQNIALTVTPTGSISGTVTSSGSGVSDAYVDAVGTGVNEGENYTSASGNYIITGLPADSYNVTVTATGYTSSWQYPVTVTANAVKTGVNFQLTAIPSGVISGTVLTTGTPLPEFKQESYMLVVLAVAMTAVFVAKLKMPKIKNSKPA